MFDKNVAIRNRYLHGPGLDNALAEEGVHQVNLTSTTVIIADTFNPSLDGVPIALTGPNKGSR